jgi:stringent starvation protein B
MTTSRPYLVRAIYDWIADNGFTPQLIVNAELDGATVPREYVQNGKIVLNVAARAVRDLELGNEWITFGARFAGRPFSVAVPIRAVLAVYAAENGVGMAFHDDDQGPGSPDSTDLKSARPSLRVVK